MSKYQKKQLEQILLNSKFLLEEHRNIVSEFNSTLDYFNSGHPTTFDTNKTDEEFTEPVLKNDRKKITRCNNF